MEVQDKIEEQIISEQKIVDYDTHEFTIEVLLSKFNNDEIFVPDYQREFVWRQDRQSKFIESLLIGIPIPYLFLSDTADGNLEIVDGWQRLSTIKAFSEGHLKLQSLEKIPSLNGKTINDLKESRKKKFKNKSIRAIILSDKADENVRFDIFERINTGSAELKAMEKRRGYLPGPANDFIRKEVVNNKQFIEMLSITQAKIKRRENEELALRFYAYSDNYLNFTKSVEGFLNDYLKIKNKEWEILSEEELDKVKTDKLNELINVFEFVQKYFPNGFYKNAKSKQISRVRFEAIAVGTNLALRENSNINPKNFNWLKSNEFIELVTTDGSNTKQRLRGRIEYVRNKLLEN